MTDYSDYSRGARSYSSTGDKLYTLKFVLTGSSGVGKTQLASRIVRKEFREESLPTVGMEFATRQLRCAEYSGVQAQIWDTAGKFPFKSLTEAFFRGAVGAMLVYDISRRSSFDDIVKWLAFVRENCHQRIEIILVGNKADMSSKMREVSMMEGMRFARKHGLSFFETSALQDRHVEEAFRQMVMSVARYLPQDTSVWAANKSRSNALPAGWVPVKVISPKEHFEKTPGSFDSQRCLFQKSMMLPPASPMPPQKPRRTTSTSSVPDERHNPSPCRNSETRAAVWYENAWTGRRVAKRPPYPAGPSDACLVSRVPRPPDPSMTGDGPSKEGYKKGWNGNEDGERGFMGMFGGMTSKWSISSLKATKNYAASASKCLSRCVES